MVTAVTEVFLMLYVFLFFFGISHVSAIFVIQVQQKYTFWLSWRNVEQMQAPEREQEVEGVKSENREAGV